MADVAGGSAAQRAGLVAGDVITSLGGRTVGSSNALSRLMIALHPADAVELGWVDRDGRSHTATVALGTGPPA